MQKMEEAYITLDVSLGCSCFHDKGDLANERGYNYIDSALFFFFYHTSSIAEWKNHEN